jgi:hypothetical protein
MSITWTGWADLATNCGMVWFMDHAEGLRGMFYLGVPTWSVTAVA